MYRRMTSAHLRRNDRFFVTQHFLGKYASPEGNSHFEMLPPERFALWLILCKMLRDESARLDVVNQIRKHHDLKPYSRWSPSCWGDGLERWAEAEHILMSFTSLEAAARCSRELAGA